jgi:L-threonylcarbamoyladenylate synthase
MRKTEKRTCLTSGDADVRRAAELIRSGELVAFPTETVYGLGANALDPAAVEKIYIAKGRPRESPLIVHVDSVEMARGLVRKWPEHAQALAEKFWPGPLTLVLPKKPHVPDRVTAGLDTVGIRMPANSLARALIHEAGVPLAAPSANRFTELSPTTAEHVRASMGDRVATILDDGPTTVGIESTVLSLATSEPVLLRPGMVTPAQIEAVIGSITVAQLPAPGSAHAAPGMYARHYSPKTPLLLTTEGRLPPSGRGAYLWINRNAGAARCVAMPGEPSAYAAALYRVLHELDSEGWDWIAFEEPPSDGAWDAIRDRLHRAAAR